MAKIILINGVVNVEESYHEIFKKERKGDWIELTENNPELKQMQKFSGIDADYKISININQIQCIKP